MFFFCFVRVLASFPKRSWIQATSSSSCFFALRYMNEQSWVQFRHDLLPPKTWHATCATTGTDPGRWPLQKVKQLEWVWMLPKSNCQHVGRHRVFVLNLLCDSDFCFFPFLSYHHGQKRRLANQKSVDKKQPLDDGGGVFFEFCFGTCHRCPSQRVLQSLPQGLWNLRACQKRRGEKSQSFFFFCAAVCGVWRRIFVDVSSLGFLIFPQMEGFFGPK